MEKILDLSVILPIKSAVTRDFVDYFDKAIKSLKNQQVGFKELIIVHSSEENLVNHLKSYDFENLKVVLLQYKETPNYSEQISAGVKKAKGKYVSFFEFDDEYATIWFKNVQKYTDVYPQVDAFLPLVIDVDEKNAFNGFTNEATFAANMTSEIGILTNETLLSYQNFQTSGMVVKKQIVDDFGGFKKSFKLTFGYELFLRLTYNNVRIMTIPKIGYKHMNMREGGIFWNYKNGSEVMTESEVKFWIESAKKESYFTQDRDIKYVATEN
jgi:glycosyltransferase involved in cell wall biosynthesis